MLKPMSRPALVMTLGGIILALGLIAFVMGGFHSFLSIEGLLIVIGGSVINAYMSYQKEDVRKAFEAIRDMLKRKPMGRDGLHRDIMQIIMWSYIVQAEDFRGLEKESARKITNPLLRYGMDLVVTGYGAEKVRDMMNTVANAEFERRCLPVTVLRNAAATAPAFGMVGTLVGMVILLNNVGNDISSIGGGMAIAMLSTLYGILVARLICLPAADKLLLKEENEHFRNHMLTEGLALLAEKQKPFYVQDKLNSFLEPARHIDFNTHMQIAARRHMSAAAA